MKSDNYIYGMIQGIISYRALYEGEEIVSCEYQHPMTGAWCERVESVLDGWEERGFGTCGLHELAVMCYTHGDNAGSDTPCDGARLVVYVDEQRVVFHIEGPHPRGEVEGNPACPQEVAEYCLEKWEELELIENTFPGLFSIEKILKCFADS